MNASLHLIALILLTAIVLIDWRYQVIPRVLSVPLFGLGLLCQSDSNIANQIVTAAITLGVLAFLRWVINRLAQQEAVGFGDVILVTLSTVWIGVEHGLFGAYLACCLASGFGLLNWYRTGNRPKQIPMAPFLVLGWGLSWQVYPFLKPLFLSH